MRTWRHHRYTRMSAMHLLAAITLVILKTAILVAGQNVTFTNTTTVITTVITTTTNNRTNATMPPAPPPYTTTMTSATTSSRMTTLPSVSSTWGPLMYCWFPCYGGSCGGYPLPQSPSSGGSLSWWFGFQFQWSRSKPRQGSPCSNGGRNRRRKGC